MLSGKGRIHTIGKRHAHVALRATVLLCLLLSMKGCLLLPILLGKLRIRSHCRTLDPLEQSRN